MAKLIKKHRHIRLLGQINGDHLHKVPRDFIRNSEYLPLLTKALEGDISGLLNILNNKEQMRLFSYLRKLNKK